MVEKNSDLIHAIKTLEERIRNLELQMEMITKPSFSDKGIENYTKSSCLNKISNLCWRIGSNFRRVGNQFFHLYRFLKLVLATYMKHPREKINTINKKKILMLTISQIEIDPRINKVAKNFTEYGYEVVIYCFLRSIEFPEVEQPFPGVTYKRVLMNDLWHPFQMYFQETIYRAAIEESCDFIHANDLTSLIVAWMLARRKKVPLIYDAHEMWSENVVYNYKKKRYEGMSWWLRKLLGFIEKRIVKDTDLFISVSDSICVEYKKRYHLKEKPLLIPNLPELKTLKYDGLTPLRKRCNLNKDHFIILYIGGISPARNIESVIKSLEYMPEKCVFVIQGPGIEYYENDYVSLAKAIGVEHRIYCLPGVKMDQVIEAASFADCGVLMLENLSLNFYWCYPNKFFEYMLAGIPVAVSDFPELSAHVKREKCGVTYNPSDPKSIAEAINWLYDHPEERKTMGENGKRSCIEKYNWDVVFHQLISSYEKIRN